jgi:hypothetical protein
MYGPAELSANLAADFARDPAQFAADSLESQQEQLRQQSLDEALAQIPGEQTSFDVVVMDLMSQVGGFFGEASGHPDFCGMAVDVKRDRDHHVLSMTIVPCDTVGGSPARRVGR